MEKKQGVGKVSSSFKDKWAFKSNSFCLNSGCFKISACYHCKVCYGYIVLLSWAKEWYGSKAMASK